MGFKNRNNKVEQKGIAKVKPDESAKNEAVVPVSIEHIRSLANDLLKLGDIPENMLSSRKKIVDSMTKLADRIHNGLDAAAKKAERETKKAERAEAKTKRDDVKKIKKLHAIKALKEKLAKMEAEVAPVDEKK